MEPESSSPHSQASANCPYPGPAESSPHTHIHPNIIHPSTPRSPQWSLSLRFPHQDPIHPLSSPIRATCQAHLILLDFITRTTLGEQYSSFSSSLCNLFHSPVTSSLLRPNILNTIFSNTLSFLSSLSVSDQVVIHVLCCKITSTTENSLFIFGIYKKFLRWKQKELLLFWVNIICLCQAETRFIMWGWRVHKVWTYILNSLL